MQTPAFATVPSTTPPPQSLGRYQIIAELGQGAMGTVYKGMDLTIERPVALKTLNSDLPDDIIDEVKERFLREAKSAGKLNHPNIVTIYEFGESNGVAFIAMEYLEGKSLQDVMRGDRLPFALVAEIIAQIADGLDYAHRFGVVHRDIKPANIMVSPHGTAKLTDFGIARVQSSTMTQAGTMLGSPKYMSPEQVLGQTIDGRADIFALGVVLYEMLARCTPFEAGEPTVFSLMQRIVTNPQPPLGEYAPGVPPAFDIILARALAKKPADRYQRGSQFANDLRNYKSLLAANGGVDPDATAITRRPGHAAEALAAAGFNPDGTPTAAPAPGAPVAAPSTTDWQAAAQFLSRTSIGKKTVFTGAVPQQPAAQGAPVAEPKPSIATWYPAGPTTVPPAPPPPRPAAPPPQAAAPAVAPAPAVTAAPPVPQPQGPTSRFAGASLVTVDPEKTLIGDLSALANDLDETHRKFVEEENAAMAEIRKGAASAKDWEQFNTGIEQVPDAKKAATEASAVRKSGVFGLLRQQASQNLKGQAEAKRDAEAESMLALDTKLRAGYDFLLEFCKELNEASPVFAGKHNLLFYGPCPDLYISDATANARMNRIDDRGKIKDVVDHLLVSYHLLSAEKGRCVVNATELPKFRAILDLHEMVYEFKETKNDFKQVIRAGFKFEFKFICSFTVKANYVEQNAEIVCRNIGSLGRTRYLVPTASLDLEFFEELTKLMLGHPSEAAAKFSVGG